MEELKFTEARIEDGWLCLKVENLAMARKFVAALQTGKMYLARIGLFREQRSKNANSLFWKACDTIAQALQTTKDEIYLNLLRDYGVHTYAVIPDRAYEKFKNEYKICEPVGPVLVNGKAGLQVRCYYGSHTYNTKQMSRLIDGALAELNDLGIDFSSPEEIARMKEEWGH